MFPDGPNQGGALKGGEGCGIVGTEQLAEQPQGEHVKVSLTCVGGEFQCVSQCREGRVRQEVPPAAAEGKP